MMYYISGRWYNQGKGKEINPPKVISNEDRYCIRSIYPRNLKNCAATVGRRPNFKIIAPTAAYNDNYYAICGLQINQSVVALPYTRGRARLLVGNTNEPVTVSWLKLMSLP